MMPRAVTAMSAKVDALEIIFRAPRWPRRDGLGPFGAVLYDALVRDAKPYALAVVESRFDDALVRAAVWGRLCNQFIDANRIDGHKGRQRLLGVMVYYLDLICDWRAIQ